MLVYRYNVIIPISYNVKSYEHSLKHSSTLFFISKLQINDISVSYFWKAGVNLRFNTSKHEKNINFEPVPGFYLVGTGEEVPQTSHLPTKKVFPEKNYFKY